MTGDTYNVDAKLLDEVLPGVFVFDGFVYVYQTTIRILVFVVFQLEGVHGIDADIQLAVICEFAHERFRIGRENMDERASLLQDIVTQNREEILGGGLGRKKRRIERHNYILDGDGLGHILDGSRLRGRRY